MEALLQFCAVLVSSKEGLRLLQGQGLLEALVPLTRAMLHQGMAGLPPLLRTQVCWRAVHTHAKTAVVVDGVAALCSATNNLY